MKPVITRTKHVRAALTAAVRVRLAIGDEFKIDAQIAAGATQADGGVFARTWTHVFHVGDVTS